MATSARKGSFLALLVLLAASLVSLFAACAMGAAWRAVVTQPPRAGFRCTTFPTGDAPPAASTRLLQAKWPLAVEYGRASDWWVHLHASGVLGPHARGAQAPSSLLRCLSLLPAHAF